MCADFQKTWRHTIIALAGLCVNTHKRQAGGRDREVLSTTTTTRRTHPPEFCTNNPPSTLDKSMTARAEEWRKVNLNFLFFYYTLSSVCWVGIARSAPLLPLHSKRNLRMMRVPLLIYDMLEVIWTQLPGTDNLSTWRGCNELWLALLSQALTSSTEASRGVTLPPLRSTLLCFDALNHPWVTRAHLVPMTKSRVSPKRRRAYLSTTTFD